VHSGPPQAMSGLASLQRRAGVVDGRQQMACGVVWSKGLMKVSDQMDLT
jgi:hypothetical protein